MAHIEVFTHKRSKSRSKIHSPGTWDMNKYIKWSLRRYLIEDTEGNPHLECTKEHCTQLNGDFSADANAAGVASCIFSTKEFALIG